MASRQMAQIGVAYLEAAVLAVLEDAPGRATTGSNQQASWHFFLRGGTRSPRLFYYLRYPRQTQRRRSGAAR